MDADCLYSSNAQSPSSSAGLICRKMARKDNHPVDIEQPSKNDKCLLASVPPELFAEIMMFTSLPSDVLAVARCSKFFFGILVNNPATDFIWRRVRLSCRPYPLPDPPPNFGEASYAAFLFDAGVCEVCKKKTKVGEMYTSFALRLKLCSNIACRENFFQHHVKDCTQGLSSSLRHMFWMPSVESSRCFSDSTPVQNWPEGRRYVRASDFDQIQPEYDAFTSPEPARQIVEYVQKKMNMLPRIMSHCVALLNWKEERDKSRAIVKARNDAWAKALARREGWDTKDLFSCEAYMFVHRLKTSRLEELQPADLVSIRPAIETQLLQIAERRKRRAHEASYRKRREDVEQHYNRLRSSGSLTLPTLAEFRKLPVIQVMQGGATTTAPVTLGAELKNSPLVGELIKNDLNKWTEQARAALCSVLGCAVWKSASSTKLHPLDRLDARFRCKQCDKVNNRYRKDGCLDFAGVCAHRCGLSKREAKRYSWDVGQFVKDDKAISVIFQLIGLCGIDIEDCKSKDMVKDLGARIQCISCIPPVMMDFQSMIGHSQRHDDMQISLLSDSEAATLLERPFKYGLATKLMASGREAKYFRAKVNYGCRHCQPGRSSGDASSVVEGNVDGKSLGLKGQKLRSFDGLRSHAKIKHDIEILRDEDFFCQSTLLWS